MRLKLAVLILISISNLTPALAAPVPKNKNKEIGNLQERLEEHKAAQEGLQKEVADIEKDLKNTRKKLVTVAQSIRDSETRLLELEKQITALEIEKKQLDNELDEERQSIAHLITALERIRRLPPQALIAKPDAPLKTAQSVMLMKDIIPMLYQQAEDLQTKLEKLEQVSEDLAQKRQNAKTANAELKKEQLELSSLSKERERLYKSTKQDLDSQEKTVALISKQAKNLQDLVKRLDDERQKQVSAQPQQKAPRKTPAKTSPIRGSVNVQLPISGIIKVRYDEPDIFGAPSKGLTIEGRGGALVTAPLSGVVRFAGYFKNYGNLIILEHDNGYHSLIAGLEQIDTIVGHNISTGEPIGLLHHAQSNQKPALYYELRFEGKTVNPAKLFTDLG